MIQDSSYFLLISYVEFLLWLYLYHEVELSVKLRPSWENFTLNFANMCKSSEKFSQVEFSSEFLPRDKLPWID